MSTLPGGPADKAGMVHEALWGVHAMLMMLHGQATSIRIEEPKKDGAEFYLQKGSVREHWQCKRHLLSQNNWTFQKLKTEGVLNFFFECTRRGETVVFASVTDATELRALAENARDAADFQEFKKAFLGGGRDKQFAELGRLLEVTDEESTFRFLRSVQVTSAAERFLNEANRCILNASFSGSAAGALDVLHVLYVSSSHKTFTAADIEAHLAERGIVRRLPVIGDNLQGKISAATASYLSGLKSKLIGGGEPIPRQLSAEWLEKLKTSKPSLDLFITASAGGGKSGCIYEIVKGLTASSVPVLAFRLDRVKPVITTIALGGEIDLPDSPVLSLARCYPNRAVVLVVDQLDFVSTTSGRNPDFFDTLSALCDEVRGLRQFQTIHLVLACREFDFQHDHRFRQCLAKDEKPLVVSKFTVEEVKTAIGSSASRLNPQQLELLTLPQNLALFVESGLLGREHPVFVTQKELSDAYWNEKQKEIGKRRPDEAHLWLPLIEKLTAEMSEKQDLSVPKSKLDEFPPDFLTLMVSEGVLTWDGRRYGFGHESFFDYCFARRAADSKDEFVSVLEADPDQQHLFRRAQLRQVLVYLREADFDRYMTNVSQALKSDRIRPHLKLLILELIANFSDPTDREFEMLLPSIESELAARRADGTNPDKLASRVFDAFFSSRHLFVVADRLGYINRWMNSGEAWLENLITLYLRWQVEHHAERVAELLEPFVGRGGDWLLRLRHMMEWGNLEKNRRYFDLFLTLLDDGTLDEARDRFASNGTFWSMLHGLSAKKPEWCAEIAAKWLLRLVARSKVEVEGIKLLHLHDDSGVHDLYEMARRGPEAVVAQVVPAIVQAAEAWLRPAREGLPQDGVWHWRNGGGQYIGLDRAYPGACATAFELLGKNDPEKLRPSVALLRASKCNSSNHLLLDAYLQAPAFFAEEAMSLLMEEPERLFCGFAGGPIWVSCCVIKACSPHCSEETFRKLEVVLREFTTIYENGPENQAYRGHGAFNLCSSLPEERTSTITKEKIREWSARFKQPDSPPPSPRAFFKISPISQEVASGYSDDEWLRAIQIFNTERGEFNPEHPEHGGSIQLSGVMGELMKADPVRYARLSLRLPPDTEPYYVATILRGATAPGVPPDLKMEVAQKAFDCTDSTRLKAALDLLASIEGKRLSDEAVLFIKRMAEHVDPSTEPWQDNPAEFSTEILVSGINSMRGNAARVIADLIGHDRGYVEIFQETVDQLAECTDISVRAAACGILYPLAHLDVEKAFELLERLARTDGRLLATGDAENFLAIYLEHKIELIRPFIARMLDSQTYEVQKAGGQLACLARLYHATETVNAERALFGDKAQREGACEVAQHNLAQSACREWCSHALTHLFADKEVEIRRRAACSFWGLWQVPEESLLPYNGLMDTFIKSAAFADDPTYLFHALVDNRQQLPEIVLDACAAFIERCTEKARDIRMTFGTDADHVSTLIFRAYAQLRRPELWMRALALIDQMCLEGLRSAGKNLDDFER